VCSVCCCSVLQCVVAVCCSPLQSVAVEYELGKRYFKVNLCVRVCVVAVCCSVLLQCVAV